MFTANSPQEIELQLQKEVFHNLNYFKLKIKKSNKLASAAEWCNWIK